MSLLDLNNHQKIHIVGIGGAGMSAIAVVLKSMGFEVSGSDVRSSHILDRLQAQGMQIYLGHREENVLSSDLLTYSSAVPVSNPELLAATARGVTVVPRSEILAAISAMKSSLCVAGTHGKTTTTTMLGMILAEAGLSPSLIVGGDVNEIGSNAIWGTGNFLVLEADESDGTFLRLMTDVAVVTSIEADHLDFYGSFDALQDAYRRFIVNAVSGAVLCADDKVITSMGLSGDRLYYYGTSDEADYQIRNFTPSKNGIAFDIVLESESLGRVDMPVFGVHNARNATAAIVASLLAGAGFEDAVSALARFAGVARRFEFRGEAKGVTFVDDYAHLPGEVKATLTAAKQLGANRTVTVFQPHRYSRTALLADDFGLAFNDADLLIVTDVYAAGEKPLPGVTGELISSAVRRNQSDMPVFYCSSRQEVVSLLKDTLCEGDLCLSLSAGDLSSLPEEIIGGWTGNSSDG
ncbi:MAG: UDP-N-acetylmuramate--L-alanine ligase [Firmicutes bacterium]|nr:UDP-N-acetylmuramate--L-alanine ligase [Bacillota bacterium]